MSQQPSRVFISYAHDPENEAHGDWVRALSDRLRHAGVDSWIDQYEHGGPAGGWQRWMERQIEQADFVLLVCTPLYLKRYRGEDSDGGRGVTFEGVVISQTLYDDHYRTKKFLPILPAAGRIEHVPLPLKGGNVYTLERDYDALYEVLADPNKVIAPELGTTPTPTTLETAYLTQLLQDNDERSLRFAIKAYAPLAGKSQRDYRPARIPTACMSPLLRFEQSQYHEPKPMAGECETHEDVVTAFKTHPRLVMLGEPGAGKTFSLWRIAAEYAEQALTEAGQVLPIVISLNQWTKDISLHDFVLAQLGELAGQFEVLYASKRLLPLFDALNEIPFDQRETKLPQVKQWLERYPATAVLVTCRERDYRGPLELPLDRLRLQPLDPPRIHTFLHQYFSEDEAAHTLAERLFWELAGGDEMHGEWEEWKRRGHEQDWEPFWVLAEIPSVRWESWGSARKRHLRNPRSLMKLAANPYLLRQMVVIYSKPPNALPRSRIDLFRMFVKDLLHREERAKPDNHYAKVKSEELVAKLKQLAWQLQSRSGAKNEVRTLLARPEAEMLMDLDHLEFAAAASLPELTVDSVRFSHQLLQEYFTAQHFAERRAEGLQASELWPAKQLGIATGWEEAAKLAAEYESDPCAFLQWLAAGNPTLAVEIAREQGCLEEGELFAVFREQWQAAITDVVNHPHPHERHAISTVLAWLGWDQRRGIGLNAQGLPDIEWVEIPAGEFIYGCDEEDYDSAPRKVLHLDTYSLSHYPVTNAQFQAFVRAGGYETDQWWEKLSKPDSLPRHEWIEGNRPVESVNWHEATAFCRWLSAQTRQDIRLPTEQQWEKAARGTDERVYPWGSEMQSGYANFNEVAEGDGECHLGSTSAVGIYPQGASPYGVEEMAGNIWEWCAKDESPYAQPLMRGGSWRDEGWYCRSANRNAPPLYSRDSHIGFRCVLGHEIQVGPPAA